MPSTTPYPRIVTDYRRAIDQRRRIADTAQVLLAKLRDLEKENHRLKKTVEILVGRCPELTDLLSTAENYLHNHDDQNRNRLDRSVSAFRRSLNRCIHPTKRTTPHGQGVFCHDCGETIG
jgi:hypothetical protein